MEYIDCNIHNLFMYEYTYHMSIYESNGKYYNERTLLNIVCNI